MKKIKEREKGSLGVNGVQRRQYVLYGVALAVPLINMLVKNIGKTYKNMKLNIGIMGI